MGVATGLVSSTHLHSMTQRVEYSGPVMDMARAISETPAGGQIICCSRTHAAVQQQVSEMGKVVPHQPDYEALYQLLR